MQSCQSNLWCRNCQSSIKVYHNNNGYIVNKSNIQGCGEPVNCTTINTTAIIDAMIQNQTCFYINTDADFYISYWSFTDGYLGERIWTPIKCSREEYAKWNSRNANIIFILLIFAVLISEIFIDVIIVILISTGKI
jgi:hypothetical protein